MKDFSYDFSGLVYKNGDFSGILGLFYHHSSILEKITCSA
jgi:hypothetical protein